MKRIARVIGDKEIEIKPIDDFSVPGSSAVEGEVPAAVEKITHEMWPNIPIIPSMSRGATDSRFLRMRGVACYGINPIATTEAEGRRAHGIDEEIRVSSLRPGVEYFHRLVMELAADSKHL
jgi:acetylornithine deacetylase/succinyl-diaminopimelate desuccinylase-like protein